MFMIFTGQSAKLDSIIDDNILCQDTIVRESGVSGIQSTMQYIALIHKNSNTTPTMEEWNRFFDQAMATGMFIGGSAIGNREIVGTKPVSDTTASIGGYMLFNSDDADLLCSLLQEHPVIKHGGTIELCELPGS